MDPLVRYNRLRRVLPLYPGLSSFMRLEYFMRLMDIYLQNDLVRRSLHA